MSAVNLVLGDQLFKGLPGLPSSHPIVMGEVQDLTRHFRYHKHKVTLFLSAMRHARNAWRSDGRIVHYAELQEQKKSIFEVLEQVGATEVFTYEPHDRFFKDALSEWCARQGVSLTTVPSPSFLTEDTHWKSYRQAKKRLLMGDFYIQQRQRLGVMVNESMPVGGKWSFDEENRQRVPKGLLAPQPVWPMPDAMTREVIQLVESEFPNHPGHAGSFALPVTWEQAESWLEDFLVQRLADFGPYEDAIQHDQTLLWHSLLSPLLNTGLLTPSYVLEKVILFGNQAKINLNSLEGFVRQLIGWREFIKRIDLEYGETNADEANFFGHVRGLGPAWYSGNTGLPPLDASIKRCMNMGWCHHIERLMVLGSCMLMSGVHPRASYQWFMEMFIDSADWVMAPNVFGMSQFSDGGVFATKPYISGSNYLLKMSDYSKGEWCDVWDGLYWGFILSHQDFFASNPRMSVMVRGANNLAPDRKNRILSAADQFINEHTTAEFPIH